MAKAEGSPGNHLDPTTVFTEAWPSLSPPLLDASTAGKAHRALAAGRSTPGEEAGETPLVGHMPMHPVHVDHRERGEGWTRSTEDLAYGPWTSASWSTVSHAHAREPWTTAQWRPMATTWQRRSLPRVRAEPSPNPALTRPNRPSSDPVRVDR